LGEDFGQEMMRQWLGREAAAIALAFFM